MNDNNKKLLTLGEISRRLGAPRHVVDYAIQRYGIKETQRAGILRLFSEDRLESIKNAIKRTGHRLANNDY